MKRLLLIDDDNDEELIFRNAIKKLVSTVECFFCNESTTAFTVIRNIDPDIIFLDVNMPRLDGLSLLRQLKANLQTTSIPVIIYSTSANDELVNKARMFGAADYFQKPDSVDDVGILIKYILERY